MLGESIRSPLMKLYSTPRRLASPMTKVGHTKVIAIIFAMIVGLT